MWLSEEGRVSHALVNACEAGPKNRVEVMLHIVEKTTLGAYCNDNLGMAKYCLNQNYIYLLTISQNCEELRT